MALKTHHTTLPLVLSIFLAQKGAAEEEGSLKYLLLFLLHSVTVHPTGKTIIIRFNGKTIAIRLQRLPNGI